MHEELIRDMLKEAAQKEKAKKKAKGRKRQKKKKEPVVLKATLKLLERWAVWRDLRNYSKCTLGSCEKIETTLCRRCEQIVDCWPDLTNKRRLIYRCSICNSVIEPFEHGLNPSYYSPPSHPRKSAPPPRKTSHLESVNAVIQQMPDDDIEILFEYGKQQDTDEGLEKWQNYMKKKGLKLDGFRTTLLAVQKKLMDRGMV